jgi:hypothetical protein
VLLHYYIKAEKTVILRQTHAKVRAIFSSNINHMNRRYEPEKSISLNESNTPDLETPFCWAKKKPGKKCPAVIVLVIEEMSGLFSYIEL